MWSSAELALQTLYKKRAYAAIAYVNNVKIYVSNSKSNWRQR